MPATRPIDKTRLDGFPGNRGNQLDAAGIGAVMDGLRAVPGLTFLDLR